MTRTKEGKKPISMGRHRPRINPIKMSLRTVEPFKQVEHNPTSAGKPKKIPLQALYNPKGKLIGYVNLDNGSLLDRSFNPSREYRSLNRKNPAHEERRKASLEFI
jgi:hypothetical protein